MGAIDPGGMPQYFLALVCSAYMIVPHSETGLHFTSP